MVVLSTEEINNPHDAPKYYDELIIEANTARETEYQYGGNMRTRIRFLRSRANRRNDNY